MWLDGCSGCHMSLLDVDEGIITIAQKADLVYGPLVDAREYPHDVDVAHRGGRGQQRGGPGKDPHGPGAHADRGGARRLRRHQPMSRACAIRCR